VPHQVNSRLRYFFNYLELCQLPVGGGRCIIGYTKWFFNSKLGQCEEIEYGGCGGNKELGFYSQAACIKTCMEES